MPPSKAQQAETALRRTALVKLRLTGAKFDDPRILELGYATAGAASKDMLRVLKKRRDDEHAEISVWRQQENDRLDALLEAIWPRATAPQPIFDREGMEIDRQIDMKAVDAVLKLMDRRAKLNGLDTPVRTEVTGADGGPLTLATGSLEEAEQLLNIVRTVTADDEEDTEEEGEQDEDAGDDDR